MIIVRTLDNKITEQINEADLQKYIDLGYVAVSSDEVDMIDENGTTKWKYKSDDSSKYRTLSVGIGGSSSLLDPVADLAALKVINTTTFTTIKEIQVATLGLYKFQPASTLTGDDVNVITPTTGSSAGRWVKQSMVIKPVYTFEEIDYGVSASLRFKNKNGGLTIRGNGTYGGYKTGTICPELIGKGKAIKFRVNEANSYPVMLICTNGSYTKQTTNYKAFSLQIFYNQFALFKEAGSTSTNIATTNYSVAFKNFPLDILIKHYKKRLSISAFEANTGTLVANYVYESDDLDLQGDMYAFSNQSAEYAYYTNIEIGNISSYGKNIVFEGDSQTKDGLS